MAAVGGPHLRNAASRTPLVDSLPSGTKGQGRQMLRREEGDTIHIIGSSKVIFYRCVPHPLGSIDDNDVGIAAPFSGNDVEQINNLDLEPRLFPAFSYRRLGRSLAEVDEPSREGPKPPAGVQAAANEEHLTAAPTAVALHNNTSGNFVLAKDDFAADGTEAAYAPKSLFLFERMTTAGAVVQVDGVRQGFAPKRIVGTPVEVSDSTRFFAGTDAAQPGNPNCGAVATLES